MVTLNTARPGFHLPGVVGVQQGEVEALESCLGEPWPVLCQHSSILHSTGWWCRTEGP